MDKRFAEAVGRVHAAPGLVDHTRAALRAARQARKRMARKVMAADDQVDALFDQVKRELIQLISTDANQGELSLDLLMVAKYLERIGDHATNVAEWVEYSITGNPPSNN